MRGAAVLAALLGWVAEPTLQGAIATEVCTTDAGIGVTVCLHDPTDRYGHKVLGPFGEYATLTSYDIDPATRARRPTGRRTLPPDRVFEDVGPRLGDLDGDGWPEIVTVVSTVAGGGALTVYTLPQGRGALPASEGIAPLQKLAATPPIGRRNRWLAPAGIADLDGDGQNDVAYVDRPHLAKVLRVWTLRGGALVQIAEAPGFSNHRIGQAFITGGVRDCGAGPELVLPNHNHSRTMIVRLEGGRLNAKAVANRADRASIDRMMQCNKS